MCSGAVKQPPAARWFSGRTAFSRRQNRLAALVAEATARGVELTDLTESNPTRCGLVAPAGVWAAFADPASGRYAPDPLGLPAARQAIVRHGAARGRALRADRLILCASTSEAYSWLFQLLADPGGRVLSPRPSYPLLSYLAALAGVELGSYPLIREEGWRVDVAAVARQLERGGVRAVVLVNPNNPTSSLVRRDDAAELAELGARHGAALIVDEVFGGYLHRPVRPDRLASFAGPGEWPALCFILDGLSKLALLPQVKLGWIAVCGPEPAAGEAMARLELIGDTFLSVATPVQHALPAILESAGALRREVEARLRANLRSIDAAIAAQGSTCPVRRLDSEAGWYAVLEIPRWQSDDEWLAALIERERLIVHPGYFFDMPEPGTMVVSLLPEPARFADAIGRAVALWSAG